MCGKWSDSSTRITFCTHCCCYCRNLFAQQHFIGHENPCVIKQNAIFTFLYMISRVNILIISKWAKNLRIIFIHSEAFSYPNKHGCVCTRNIKQQLSKIFDVYPNVFWARAHKKTGRRRESVKGKREYNTHIHHEKLVGYINIYLLSRPMYSTVNDIIFPEFIQLCTEFSAPS